MALFLTPSPRLHAVPLIDPNPARRVEVGPGSFDSWPALFEKHPDALDYLLKRGDYRGWGALEFKDHPGNTKERPRTIRFFEPQAAWTLHPVDRSAEARVKSVKFDGAGTRDWLIQGLTIVASSDDDPAALVVMSQGVRDITVDACLIEGARQYGCRIREATDCTVQRCVIREVLNPSGADAIGIYVGNVRRAVRGIRIVDNELYNNGDGIQLNDYKRMPWSDVEVLIEGNDIYLEPDRYIGATNTTRAENGIDLKAGSHTPYSTVITSNRLWGFRRNAKPRQPDGTPKKPSALGEALVVQRFCRNVVARGNIFADCPRAMKDENWKQLKGFPVDPDRPRDVFFIGNQFCDIRDRANGEQGAIIKPITARLAFFGNHFARSDFLADTTPPNYRPPGPVFEGNTLVGVDSRQRPRNKPSGEDLPFDAALNASAAGPSGFVPYERKRWTGPEWSRGAVPSDRIEGLPNHRPVDARTRRL